MSSDVALRDGSTLQVRATRASDAKPLAAFLGALSEQALWFRFLGGVDPDRMARLLVERGVASEPGELHVRMPARLGPDARERFEERDRSAAVAAVRHVFEPASIAVVGASRDPGISAWPARARRRRARRARARRRAAGPAPGRRRCG